VGQIYTAQFQIFILRQPTADSRLPTADRFDENLISKSKEFTESWKSGKEWPFPDLSDSKVKEINNTLDFPN
jgi:hypothetical protein